MTHKNKLTVRVILSSLSVYVIGVIATIGIGSLFGIMSLFKSRVSDKMVNKLVLIWASINLTALQKICRLDYQVHGRENLSNLLKTHENFIVASNHQSAWDIPACMMIFKRITFLTKESLLKIPFFGWGFAMLRPVAINRKNKTSAMRSLLEQGAKRLAEGYILIAFPEGTRQPMHTLGKYQIGSLLLATKTNSIVLPIIHNAGNFWARKSPWRFPGVVQLVIGEPIDSSKYKPRELTEMLEQWSRHQLQLIHDGKPDPHLKIDNLKQ